MPLDYAGNSLGTARGLNITPGTQTFTDWVGSLDTNDYYRFTLNGRSSFNLSLNGLSADADVQLLNGNGQVLQSSTRSGTSAESISATLDGGTYYVRAYRYSGDTYYNLGVSATPVTPPDYAGNTITTARNITVGSTTSTYSDWVGTLDTNDYYRFSVGSNSNLAVTLNGLSGDADIQLLDSSGVTVMQGSYNGGITADSINRQVGAGTYYLRVYPMSGVNSNYNLSVSANPVAPSDYAGNTLSTARNISVGSTTSTYSDWVGTLDTNDYYRFSLNGTSNFNLSLNGLSGDADVQLLDGNGISIQSSTYSGTTPDSINRQLAAGTYYIRVYPMSGVNTNYNLSVSANPVAPLDPGNTLSTAE